MSKPRTPEHFPRMKVRGGGRPTWRIIRRTERTYRRFEVAVTALGRSANRANQAAANLGAAFRKDVR